MLRGTTLILMVLMVAMISTPRANAQKINTVTGGGNPGNPDNPKPLPTPSPPSPSGMGGVPSCPFPLAAGASTTFSATYNGQGVACYNVADSIRNCECPDIFKISACCRGSTCTYDQTTKCNSCCQSPGGN